MTTNSDDQNVVQNPNVIQSPAQRWMAVGEIASAMRAHYQADDFKLDSICKALVPEQVSVMVVGQVKVGKSMFINGLTGRGGMLPSDVNPLTTVVTNLHFNAAKQQTEGADFHFYDEAQWERLTSRDGMATEGRSDSKEMLLRKHVDEMQARAEQNLGTGFRDFLGKTHKFDTVDTSVLEQYICSESSTPEAVDQDQYNDLIRVADVYFDTSPFPLPITITDTPGVNDPFLIRDEITWQTIGQADYYLVILSAHQAMSQMDEKLMRALQENGSGRAIVFINRIDELGDCDADAKLLRSAVREDISGIFGGAPGAVLAGSALWADYAATGDDTDIDHEQILSWINANPYLQTRLQQGISSGDHLRKNERANREDILRYRALIASGMPELRHFLSSVLMHQMPDTDLETLVLKLLQVAATEEESALSQMRPTEEPTAPTEKPEVVLEDIKAILDEELGIISLKVSESFQGLMRDLDTENLRTGARDDLSSEPGAETEAQLPERLNDLRVEFLAGVQTIKSEIVRDLTEVQYGLEPELGRFLDETSDENLQMNMNLVHQFTPDISLLWREASASDAKSWVQRLFQRGAAKKWPRNKMHVISEALVSDAQTALLNRIEAVLKHYMASVSGCMYEQKTGVASQGAAGDDSADQAARERLQHAQSFADSLRRLADAPTGTKQEMGQSA